MATPIGAAAYDPVGSPDKFVVDLRAVDQVLHLLARAVRHVHTYPATSPLRAAAIAACGGALASLQGREQIHARVTMHELVVDEASIGTGTIVESELVRRLHRGSVGAITIDRTASLRDLARFCSDLISLHEHPDATTTLPDLLAEHGVEKIVARMAYRPAVFDLGVPRAPLRDLVERERRRRESVGVPGPTAYLYPPDKGWVRLDPGSDFTTISLVDLAVLVNDPSEFAGMLLRLTDDQPAGSEARSALETKFSDVATLFASLDPRLAQMMFAKLARAVLDLAPDQRQALLQRTILPGLLDGRADGRVLTEFPDEDLAESLCLLLDLETAAPEVLSAALDRMKLTADRRQALAPLLDAGTAERARAGWLRRADEQAPGAEGYARTLLRADGAAGGQFAELAAFDLSIDGQTGAALTQLRGDIEDGDLVVGRLRCLSSLVRLEPNPNIVEAFLGRISALLGELERAGRWRDLAWWLADERQIAEVLRETRPDVADAIAASLDTFCTCERTLALLEMYDQGGAPGALAASLFESYGPAVIPVAIALLDDAAAQGKLRSLVRLMCEHAAVLAPSLVRQVGRAGTAAAVAIVRALGFAGAGYEAAIGAQFTRRDDEVAREALRALARIGSAQAAGLVAGQLGHPSARVRVAAYEALYRFAPPLVQGHLRQMLAAPDFVRRHPDAAVRVLDRAVRTDPGGLQPTLTALAPFRFHFWNPALARLGARARELMRR